VKQAVKAARTQGLGRGIRVASNWKERPPDTFGSEEPWTSLGPRVGSRRIRGASAATVIGSTLAAQVTVLSVAADAPAVDTMVSVSIGMTILAGSVPGTYSGDFSVDVVAGTAASAP